MIYHIRHLILLFLILLGSACEKQTPVILGTIEWDRISLPAPASEQITDIQITEGTLVTKGQVLMQLDTAHAKAKAAVAQNEVLQIEQTLKIVRIGPRSENKREASERLSSLKAQARNAEAQLVRVRALMSKQLLPRADLDRAIAAASSAQAEVRAAQASSDLLQNGNRTEDVIQAQARLSAAKAQAESTEIDLQRLTLRAPRVARVDSLPYKQGDQPAVGAPLAVLLVGDSPYARVYVPEPMRPSLKIGDLLDVVIDGSPTIYAGKLRSIRSEPSFTPYYALSGKDAARLSYIAEISLGIDAANLPSGMPARVYMKDSTLKASHE
jgi:HlyD family secretion protein